MLIKDRQGHIGQQRRENPTLWGAGDAVFGGAFYLGEDATFKNAFTSASTRLSPTRARTRSIRAECEISSKQAVMSPSSTHSYVLDARKRVSRPWASCARRLGLKPYEHDSKSASKIGSSTSLAAAARRDRPVGMPSGRSCLPLSGSSVQTAARAETAGPQLIPQLGEEVLRTDAFPNRSGGLAVNSCRACALIFSHPVPCHRQESWVDDEVEQIVEPAMRIVGRPTVQLGLDLPYPLLGLKQAMQ